MIHYRIATMLDLELLWNKNIAENSEDARWLRWKEDFIRRNRNGEAVTFVVLQDEQPIGEVTLAFTQSGSRAVLADGIHSGYVQALRIRQEAEGRGYVSKLMRLLESYAAERGLSQVVIGVEAAETRNLAIYLHWGYDQFLMAEKDNGALVLFYAKQLSKIK